MPLGKSAITKARQKVDWKAFEYLLSILNCEEQYPSLKWHGHHVRAVDGTRLVLPAGSEICEHFPRYHSSRSREVEHYPKARLLVAANVFTGQVTHARLGPYRESERDQALMIFDQFKKGDIVLLDRGFEGARIWSALEEKKMYFIARIRISENQGNNFISGRLLKTADTEKQFTYEGHPSHGEKKYCLRLRLVRSRRRTDGSCIVLITNLLDERKYPRKHLLEIYRERWQAEKAFLRIKQIFKVQRFHSRKLNGVMQELYAGLISQAWVSAWLLRAAQMKERFKNRSIINYKSAAQILSTILPTLTRARNKIEQIIRRIIAIVHKRQPGRSYPRVSHQPPNPWINNRYPTHYEQMKYRPDPVKWWREKKK